MKNLKSYILVLAALFGGSVALTSCQDDFDEMHIDEPVATIKPNTTIYELKTMYWDDAVNYATKIGLWSESLEQVLKEQDAACTPLPKNYGDRIIIHGYVTTSDEAGNVFKSIVIQDETGSLAMSVNSYNLYLKYRRGQEVVLDVTDMYIGKYNGLQQLGMPEWYENGNAWETSFMGPEFFEAHVQLNGWPNVETIDTITVNSFDQLSSNPKGLRQWQSQIVRFNNVEFQNGGTQTFSTYHSSGVNQNILDVNGATLPVRTSGYSNFWNRTLPEGRGDVVAICSYYGTTGWQLVLIDADGCMNFGNPTVSPGTKDNPYTVAEAVKLEADGTPADGWVSGYIVGAVGPEVETISSNNDIEWTSDVTLANTLVIGETPETKDLAQCLVISLPSGSKLRELGNLRENPGNYGKAISVKGTFAEYMGTYGVTDNRGAVDEFTIEGVNTGVESGDGSAEKPYNVGQIVAMNPISTTEAVATGVWVSGYIVGSMPTGGSSTTLSGTIFGLDDAANTNFVIAADPNETDYTKCIGIQLPTTMRDALSLQKVPGNLGKQVSLKGDVMKYCGGPGLKNLTEYKLGDGGGDTPVTPPADPVSSLDENFEGGAIPSTWTQVTVSGNKTWYAREFDSNWYVNMTGYNGTAPFDQWLITPPVDMSKVSNKNLSFDSQVNGYGSTTTKLEVYVLSSADPNTATKTQLQPTLPAAPASGYSSWLNSGSISLSAQTGVVYIGFRYVATQDANYATWCVDNVKLGAGGGTVTPPDPPVTGDDKAGFSTFNGGAPKSTYGTYTSTTGWTAENCNILGGQEAGKADSNPRFAFIGGVSTLAPCLNGKAGSAGTLTSSTLTGGIATLTFKYGFAYKDTQCQFTVNIKQNGAVVKTQTVTLNTIEQYKAYDFSMDVNIKGDFVIEIVNDALGQKTTNSERVAIWNLNWN